MQEKDEKRQGGDNKRIRKLEKQVKESRQMIAWLSNEIHRWRMKRKLTKKGEKLKD